MKITAIQIPGVLVIEPQVFGDNSGFFYESVNHRKFSAMFGRPATFVAGDQSRSCKNVLRGLHYQIQQPQGKLVRVVQGTIFDVAVDIPGSVPTFGRNVIVELSNDNK